MLVRRYKQQPPDPVKSAIAITIRYRRPNHSSSSIGLKRVAAVLELAPLSKLFLNFALDTLNIFPRVTIRHVVSY